MVATNRIDIGWETLIAIIFIVLALTVLGIVALTRNGHWYRIMRVGFFVERNHERELDEADEPEEKDPQP